MSSEALPTRLHKDFRAEAAAIFPKIKARRRFLGISASGMEERTGGRVTRQTVADLDCGRRRDVRLSEALALADALGIEIEDLLDPNIDPAAAGDLCRPRGIETVSVYRDFKAAVASIGPKIRALKQLFGISAEELAERTGRTLTRQVVADITSGRNRDMKLSYALALSGALGTRIEHLLDPDIDATAIWLGLRLPQETLSKASEIASPADERSAHNLSCLTTQDIRRIHAVSSQSRRSQGRVPA